MKRTKIGQKGISMPPIDQHIPWSRSGYKKDDQGGLGKTGGTKAWRSLFGANVRSVWRQAAVGDFSADKLGVCFHFFKRNKWGN